MQGDHISSNEVVTVPTKERVGPYQMPSYGLMQQKTCLQTASLDLQSAEEVVQNKEFQNQYVTYNGIVTQPKVVAERLCEKLVTSFGDRFPISPVLEATFISNFKNWPLPGSDAIKELGQNEVSVLVNQFKGLLVEAERDPKEIPAEWNCLKTTVYKRFSSRLTSKTLEWEDLHGSCGEDLPNILGLISLVRALPPNSVRNEATISTMKLTKGKRRARMNNNTLDDLLMINLESSSVDQYDPQDAMTKWMNTKGKRRLHYKRAPIQAGSTDTQMMETSDLLNRVQSDTTDTQMDTSDSFHEPDSQTSDLSDLASELVADSEDNADEDLDYDSDSDVEQTERENDALLNMIIEYEYGLE